MPEISHYSSKFQGPPRTIEVDAIVPTHVKKKKKERGRREEEKEEEEEEGARQKKPRRRRKKKGRRRRRAEKALVLVTDFFFFLVIYLCQLKLVYWLKLVGMTETHRNGSKNFPRWNKGVSRSGLHTGTRFSDWNKMVYTTMPMITIPSFGVLTR